MYNWSLQLPIAARGTMESPFLCDTQEPWPILYPRTLTFTTLNFECVWKQGIFNVIRTCEEQCTIDVCNYQMQVKWFPSVLYIWHIIKNHDLQPPPISNMHESSQCLMRSPCLLLHLLIAKMKCTFNNIRRTVTVKLGFCLNVRHDRINT